MKILITGGAGFIGSNLVESLLQNDKISLVRVLDNFATGHKKNIEEFFSNPKFGFIEGDIRNMDDCMLACKGIDAISHQAALGSVPRSIADPLTSHQVNVNGFINILQAARTNNIKRIVYASSSSVYGDLNETPKVENRIGKVLSPYAATKMSNELYGEAFAKCYGLTTVGLRYFNVFGPKQDPNGPYAAVIPLFIKSALNNQLPIINGDGSITRDFTPILNVVNANLYAILKELNTGANYVFNVACGQTTSLLEIWEMIKEITSANVDPVFGFERKGDILSSLADISSITQKLNLNIDKDLRTNLVETIAFYNK